MPYKSNAQRKKFHAMLGRGEISASTVKEFDRASKGKKLPEHVKSSAVLGVADALSRLGFKAAGEELRLKIPDRTFHGYDAAAKNEAERGHAKKADVGGGYGDRRSSEDLAAILGMLDDPTQGGPLDSSKNPLDRSTMWGPPSSTAAGDTAGRTMDMGTPGAAGLV